MEILAEQVDTGVFQSVTGSSQKSIELFILFVEDGIAGRMPCLECRGHCQTYITHTDPVRHLLLPDTQGKPRTCLEWTWRFHHVVNARLHKTQGGIEVTPESLPLGDLRIFLNALKDGLGCGHCGSVEAASDGSRNPSRNLRPRRHLLE